MTDANTAEEKVEILRGAAGYATEHGLMSPPITVGDASRIADLIETQAKRIAELERALELQGNAARMGMNAAKQTSSIQLELARKLRAESSPDALESERAMNAELTEQVQRLEEEVARLRGPEPDTRLPTIPGYTTDDDLCKVAYTFDSTGVAGAIHHFHFRQRDLLALLRLIQQKAQEFERRHPETSTPSVARIMDARMLWSMTCACECEGCKDVDAVLMALSGGQPVPETSTIQPQGSHPGETEPHIPSSGTASPTDGTSAAVGPLPDISEELKTIEQTIAEFRHAYNSGSSWYTRGESGLRSQVRMWMDKGYEALVAIKKKRQPETRECKHPNGFMPATEPESNSFEIVDYVCIHCGASKPHPETGERQP